MCAWWLNRFLLFVIALWVSQPAIHPATGQAAPTIRGSVTALRLDGDRLLIGQGTSLIEARVTPDSLDVIRSIDLHRHDLRAITTSQGITFALSEDGLTTLDTAGNVRDFAQGGGQSLAVRNGRVYVGALQAGIRVYRVDTAGKLARLGLIPTVGAAVDVAPESDSLLWVAEGDAGLRLYDTSNPARLETAPALLWIANLAPASVIRISGTRVYIGHGNQLSVLDTLDIHAPRLLGTFALDGPAAQVGGLIVQGSRAFVGRVDTAGPDVIALDLSNPRAVTSVAQFGDSGTGEQFALRGDDLFVGSGRLGLRRIRFGGGAPTLVAAWESLGPASPCVADIPGHPQPPNLGDVPGGPVTLTWTSGCNSGTYALQIDQTLVSTMDTPSYTFTPRHGITRWQVTAMDRRGSRLVGPTWIFETLIDGWLAPAASAPHPDLLYAPAPQIKLQTPGSVLAATCAALIAGLMLVVVIAWAIGVLAERRSADRYGNLR